MSTGRFALISVVLAMPAAGCCGLFGICEPPQPTVYSQNYTPLPTPIGPPTTSVDPKFKDTIVGEVINPTDISVQSLGGGCVIGTPVTQASGSLTSDYDIRVNGEAKANIEKFLNASINSNYVKTVKISANDVYTDTLIGVDRNPIIGACTLSHDDLNKYGLISVAHSAKSFSMNFVRDDNQSVDLSSGTDVTKALGGPISVNGSVTANNTFNYTSPANTRVFYEIILLSPVPTISETQTHEFGQADLSNSPLPYAPYAQFFITKDPTGRALTLHIIKAAASPKDVRLSEGRWTEFSFESANYDVMIYNVSGDSYAITFHLVSAPSQRIAWQLPTVH